jgi:hypothetical protein
VEIQEQRPSLAVSIVQPVKLRKDRIRQFRPRIAGNRLAVDPRASDLPEPKRDRLVAAFRLALARAMAGLDPTLRQRLAFYYGHQLTLAQIGRLFREHEATVSRKIDRARRDLRTAVDRELRQRHHLAGAEVERAIELGLPEAGGDLARLLAGPEHPGAGAMPGAGRTNQGLSPPPGRAAAAVAAVASTSTASPQDREPRTFQEWGGS